MTLALAQVSTNTYTVPGPMVPPKLVASPFAEDANTLPQPETAAGRVGAQGDAMHDGLREAMVTVVVARPNRRGPFWRAAEIAAAGVASTAGATHS